MTLPLRCCVLAVMMATLMLSLAGCQAPRLPQPTQVVYPGQTEYGQDLDLVVEREGRGHIRIHNRTAVPYEGMVLWLNQQYARAIERIEIGHQDNRLSLTTFLNEHGEKYPIGSLLRPEQSRPVVLAELFDPVTAKRHRIVVRQ